MKKKILILIGIIIVAIVVVTNLTIYKDWTEWNDIKDSNYSQYYKNYLVDYPDGLYVNEAKQKYSDLFLKYINEKDIADLEEYLVIVGDGNYKQDSIQLMLSDQRGKDIISFNESSKVIQEIVGSGIRNISLRLKSKVNYPIKVIIPSGTFFVSGTKSAQNMIATAVTEVLLKDNYWETIDIPVACANIKKDVPGEKNEFSIKSTSGQKILENLFENTSTEDQPYAVIQAAVWIITDNANYDDLGILVMKGIGWEYFGGTRLIDEEEAAIAMKLCSEAGLNIKKSRIWQDRKKILSGLEDKDLKKWLKNK